MRIGLNLLAADVHARGRPSQVVEATTQVEGRVIA